jgi:predicted homoserine dehydrogenase-like protein
MSKPTRWPALARAQGARAGVIYSMAYGDQPALIAEMVDWARSAGFTVAAAGKGTKYLPAYHTVTPDGVWEHYGLTAAEAKRAGMNSQMFNSFLDGTKSAIEMAAVANACDLDVPHDGLAFRRAAPTNSPACCGRRPWAACSTTTAWSRSSRR